MNTISNFLARNLRGGGVKCFILSLCLLFPGLATTFAQVDDYRVKKDSLLRQISLLKGEPKLAAYHELTNLLWDYETDIDTTLKYYAIYQKEAQKQESIKYEVYARINVMKLLYNVVRYKEFIERADETLDFLSKNDMWAGYYEVYQLLLNSWLYSGQKEKSLQASKKLYDEAKKRNHPKGIATALFQMGIIYADLNRYEEGEKCLRECMMIVRQYDEITTFRLMVYVYLVNNILLNHKYDDANQFLKEWESDLKKFEIQIKQQLPEAWANVYSGYISLFEAKKEFDKIEPYCQLIEISTPNSEINKRKVAHFRSIALLGQKQYQKALEQVEIYQNLAIQAGQSNAITEALQYKAYLFGYLGRPDEARLAIDKVIAYRDSIHTLENNARLDEIHTQYEVDKITAEKEKKQIYLLFAVILCFLIVIVWIMHFRWITKKNRAMVKLIQELQNSQAPLFKLETEIDPDLCPDSRKDTICIQLHDMLHKDHLYRDSNLVQDELIERLETTKILFREAFHDCFGTSFTVYINHLRLRDAISLLENSDLSLADIAKKVGFGTVRTFHRRFTSKYDMSPSDFRKLANKK